MRMALGAERLDILRLVVGKGFRLAITGVIVGVALSSLLGKFVQQQLYAVTPLDLATYSVMTGFLLLKAFIASLLPAWRALTIEPQSALRQR